MCSLPGDQRCIRRRTMQMALVRRARSEEEQAAMRERAELHARWAQQDAAARAAACARREALTKLTEDVEEFNRHVPVSGEGFRVFSAQDMEISIERKL